MNKSAYAAGQSTRKSINAGAAKAASTAKAGVVAVGSFFRGLLAQPVEAKPTARRIATAKAKSARKSTAK